MAQLPLTMLVDLTVSGGAVTTLSSGTISLVAGTVYGISWGMNFNSTLQQGAIYFQDTTDGNYARTYIQSNNSGGGGNTAFFATNNGKTSQGYGLIGLENDTPYYGYSHLDSDENVGNTFGVVYSGYNTSITTVTEVQMVATLGNFQNGSFLRIWEQIQS
jgi:hypothetical protein